MRDAKADVTHLSGDSYDSARGLSGQITNLRQPRRPELDRQTTDGVPSDDPPLRDVRERSLPADSDRSASPDTTMVGFAAQNRGRGGADAAADGSAEAARDHGDGSEGPGRRRTLTPTGLVFALDDADRPRRDGFGLVEPVVVRAEAPQSESSRDSNQSSATLHIGREAAQVFDVLSFDGAEDLHRLFVFAVDFAIALNAADEFEEAIATGEHASLVLRSEGRETRRVRGMIRDCEFLGHGHSHAYFRAIIVPLIWPLTRRVNCRIFQDCTTPRIIGSVLADYGMTSRDVLFVLHENYQPRNYCVQYRESDWDFISRLMEEDGMHCFYRERDGRSVLQITDGAHGHLDASEGCEAVFHAPEGLTPQPGTVFRLRARREVRAGKTTLTDYANVRPSLPLAATADASLVARSSSQGERSSTRTRDDAAGGDRAMKPGRSGGPLDQPYEVFDYPGEYRSPEHGRRVARVRAQELFTLRDQFSGASTRMDFAVGHELAIVGHALARMNRRMLLTSVRHRGRTQMAVDVSYVPEGADESEAGLRPHYQNEFVAMPAEQEFRPPRSTPRPRVGGPQTATVVGPAGKEIHTDEYGRVKVRFRWDREELLEHDGRQKSDSTCWIRVSQAWAGAGFGGIAVPRIGQEVIVDFLEGDPDQPIVTGRVYNGASQAPQSMPAPMRMTGTGPEPIPAMQGRPQNLPDTATRTTIRSNSTPGGGGANELSLDDAAGGELLYFNATKDFVHTIGDFSTTTVGNDMKLSVGNCLFEFVAISHDVFIGINETQFIGCNRTEVVGCNETITIGMNRTEAVGMNETLSVGLNRTEVIGVNHTETIGTDMNVMVGNDINIVAGHSITIVTGKSKIYMNKDGTIRITGKVIEVNASTSLTEQSPTTKIVGATNMAMMGAATQIRGNNIQVLADKLLHMESAGKLDSVAATENVIQGKPIKLN